MIKLADYGLSEAERMHVYKRLLMHADWTLIRRRLLEREYLDMLAELCAGHHGRKVQEREKVRLRQMRHKLQQHRQKFQQRTESMKSILRRRSWALALFRLRRNRSVSFYSDIWPFVKAAIEAEAPHVLQQLLTLAPIEEEGGDFLFAYMIT
jgi:hypothetical protein